MKETVMSYSNDEKETLINYDYLTGLYSIYTNVPSHITQCYKKYSDYDIKVISVHQSGAPSCVEVRNVPKAISFRKSTKTK